MSNDTDVFEVKLSGPIMVATKEDGLIECDTILLKAPSSKNRREASKIKRLCSKAVMAYGGNSQTESTEKKESRDVEITGVEVVNMLAGSAIDDDDLLERLYELFIILLVNGCGEVAGQRMTGGLVDKISYEDLEKVFGEYVKYFLLKSLLTSKSGEE
jgi:riboflavin biosynthesis pyrimidine reductase